MNLNIVLISHSRAYFKGGRGVFAIMLVVYQKRLLQLILSIGLSC